MVTLEHFEYTPPEYPLEDYARAYPFRYSDEDFPNLARALDRQFPARMFRAGPCSFWTLGGARRPSRFSAP